MRPPSTWSTPLPALTRVNVVGASGSGKSTFASKLAAVLAVPYVQMDQVYWEPRWTEPPDHVFFPRLERAISGERWVLDGNYHRTAPIKWARATTVIWLDLSLPRVLFQVTSRSLRRAWTSDELWPNTGNRESFKKVFSRQSMVLYSLRTHGSVRARYERVQGEPSFCHLQFVRLRSRREAATFLRAARQQSETGTLEPKLIATQRGGSESAHDEAQTLR
jgi:adenylate kinase family enzyme